MFETLFEVPRAVKLHSQTPYVEERARFIPHLVQQRYSRTHVIATAELIRLAVSELGLDPTLQTTTERINGAVEKWCQDRIRYGRAIHGRGLRKVLRGAIKRWFRFLGRLEKPSSIVPRFKNVLDAYVLWMATERGFSPRTVQNYSSHARYFLDWYATRGKPLSKVKPTDIDDYLIEKGEQGWCRRTVAHCTDLLQALFRYLSSRDLCDAWIAEGIQGPRIYSCELLPSGPSWDNVKRLLATMETEKPSDILIRAFTLFSAVYGLRSSEVANLTIEDIDWEADQITIRRAKRGRFQTFPLISTVGNAIAKYLQIRPPSSHRDIFLTVADVDLSSHVLTVRETKFYKTRLVPIGRRFAEELKAWFVKREHLPFPRGGDSAFFAIQKGRGISASWAGLLFRRLVDRLGIQRHDGCKYRPRLHDIRHTFVVNRVVTWYRDGSDVQRLLPYLSTYLGHIENASTQRYLTMTPELLQEASHRFEKYALSEVRHA